MVFPVHYITNGIWGPKFYSVKLNVSAFSTWENYIYFATYPSNSKYYGSSVSTTEHSRDYKSSGSNKDYITLSYLSYISTSLELPYRSQCMDYTKLGLSSQAHCFDKCVQSRTITLLKKVPFSTLTEEPIDLPFLSIRDIMTSDIKNITSMIHGKCRSTCSRQDCTKEEFTPVIVSAGPSSLLAFDLYTTTSPTINTIN